MNCKKNLEKRLGGWAQVRSANHISKLDKIKKKEKNIFKGG